MERKEEGIELKSERVHEKSPCVYLSTWEPHSDCAEENALLGKWVEGRRDGSKPLGRTVALPDICRTITHMSDNRVNHDLAVLDGSPKRFCPGGPWGECVRYLAFRTLGSGRSVIRNVVCQLPDEKFLKKIGGGS